MGGGDACGAIGCSNARRKESCRGKSFFRFPKDEKRCKEWVQRTRREDLIGKTAAELYASGIQLCSDHFEKRQFLYPDKTNKLGWNAVPSVFKNIPNPPPRISTLRKLPKQRVQDAVLRCPPEKKRKSSGTGLQASLSSDIDFAQHMDVELKVDAIPPFWKKTYTISISEQTLGFSGQKMESLDPLVTTDVKIEIDVAEEDDPCIKQECGEGMGAPHIEADDIEADEHQSNCQTTDEDTDNTAAVKRDSSVQQVKLKPVVKVETDKPLEYPVLNEASGAVNSTCDCVDKGIKLESDISTLSWPFQHSEDSLEHEVKLVPGVTLESGTKSDSSVNCLEHTDASAVNSTAQYARGHWANSFSQPTHSCAQANCTRQSPDRLCVLGGCCMDKDINLEPSGISYKLEPLHSENGIGNVVCVYNGDINMYQCKLQMKSDTVILSDSNVEMFDAAASNVHSFVSGAVSLHLYECGKPAADLPVVPQNDLMTGAHSDLRTSPHNGLMTEMAEFRHGKSSVCLEGEALSQEPKSHTVECQHEQENETEYVCELCKVSFGSPRQLKQHMSTHTRRKPHTVTTEQSTTVDCTSMDVHTQTDRPSARKWARKHCKGSFVNPHHLNKHLCTYRHKCTECGACFPFANNLETHILTHTCQTPHKCTECVASFTCASSLRAHKLIHSGQKPHKCTECGARFTFVNNLKKHMLVHTGQRPHKCRECCASFTQASSLQTHILIHTGQKPHKCTECGASFTQAGNLQMHIQHIHTGQNKVRVHLFECTMCRSCFADASSLNRHMVKSHGDKGLVDVEPVAYNLMSWKTI